MRFRVFFCFILALLVVCFAAGLVRSMPVLPDERAIIITIDDGPREWILPKFLEFFRKESIPATFFVLCFRFEANEQLEDLLFFVHQEGHGIANHTYGHGNMPEFVRKKGLQWVMNDVERCSKRIKSVIGYSPRFFRPPFWALSDEMYRDLVSRNYMVQMLDRSSLSAAERKMRDVNTTDYLFHERYQRDPEGATAALAREIRRMIAARERTGIFVHVLALHEIPVALAALEALVPEWRQNGYQFRTLPWLYGTGGYGK